MPGQVHRSGRPSGPSGVHRGYPVRLESAACPVFVALTVTGIDPSRRSPRWLARRVQLAGMRPISLAVDITNYVMLETGQRVRDAGHRLSLVLPGDLAQRARVRGREHHDARRRLYPQSRPSRGRPSACRRISSSRRDAGPNRSVGAHKPPIDRAASSIVHGRAVDAQLGVDRPFAQPHGGRRGWDGRRMRRAGSRDGVT